MIRRPPRSTQSRSSAASDVYKRQRSPGRSWAPARPTGSQRCDGVSRAGSSLSLIHISEPTRLGMISYAVFCLKKKKKKKKKKIQKARKKTKKKKTIEQ